MEVYIDGVLFKAHGEVADNYSNSLPLAGRHLGKYERLND